MGQLAISRSPESGRTRSASVAPARAGRPGLPVAMLLCIVLVAACSSGGSTSKKEAQEHTAHTATTAAPAAAAPAAPTPAFPFTLRGTDGGTVQLTRPAERIVSLSAGTTETLFAIGAGHAVVAADRFSDYPEAARALPKVEYTRPNVEALAGFRPDLVVAATRQKDSIPAIQAAGMTPVLLEEPTNVQGVVERVRLFGRVTAHTAEAERLAEEMERRIRAVADKLAGVDRGPRIFHEISSEFYTAAPNSFIGDLYTLLKARNIAEGGAVSFPQLSQEVIIQRDPEVIVLADGREGVTVEHVKARPGWSAISAVRTGRVHLLTDEQADILSRPGPRVVDALELLAKLLYPDRF